MQSSEGPYLWVIRHGRAEPACPSGCDAERPLDSKGKRQATWLGELLAEDKARPCHIIASPAVRTWTTACLIGAKLDLDPYPEGALTCEHALSHALKAASKAHCKLNTDSLALIGHNPTLSDLVGWLVHGIGGSGLSLRTGEAALLQLDPESLFGQPGSAKVVSFRRMGDEAGIRVP